MLSNTSLYFISDMGVTDHRHYDNIESKIESSTSGMLFKK